MFETLGNFLNGQLAPVVAQMVAAMATYLTPIVLAAVTAWIVHYGMEYMTGTTNMSVPAFAFKCAKMAIIFSLSLTAGNYMGVVYPTLQGISNDFVTLVTNAMPNGGNCPGANSFVQLDCAGKKIMSTASELTAAASQNIGPMSIWDFSITLILKILSLTIGLGIFLIGTVMFLVMVGYQLIVISVNMTFLLALGPIFIVCYAFDATKQYFWNWFGKILYFFVVQGLLFAYVTLTIGLISSYISKGSFTGSYQDLGDAISPPLAIIGGGILMIIMAMMTKEIDGLAATLTGGAGGGTGSGGAMALGATMNKAAGAMAGARIAQLAKSRIAGLGERLKNKQITPKEHDRGTQRWQTVLDAVSRNRNN